MSVADIVAAATRGLITGIRESSRRYSPRMHAKLFQQHWATKAAPDVCFYCNKPRWRWEPNETCPRKGG